jgi:hypothetical protein
MDKVQEPSNSEIIWLLEGCVGKGKEYAVPV